MMSQDVIRNVKLHSPLTVCKKYQAPARPSFQELKQKYESPPAAEPAARMWKPKSPKKLSKSKVKQMASMFNNRISQIIRRDNDVTKYSSLINESLSPEAKPKSKPTLLPKPLPLPGPRLRANKEKAPVPSPRTKSKAKIPQAAICIVAEDVFAKLTVKDKALLYTQFVEDMSKKNSKFGKHGEIIEANVKKEVARGEVVNEKQESVKHLLRDLEARCAFPKQHFSVTGVQRINAMPATSRKLNASIKAKEFEDIRPEKLSHISTLTITLNSYQPEKKRQRRSRSLPRPKTQDGNQMIEECNSTNDLNHKRNNDEMRSTLPIEAYAPPKKIRRSRAEHLAPNSLFKSQELENLFFTWLREQHQKKMALTDAPVLQEITQKSSIDKLLEEAIAKLECVEIKQKKEDSTSIPTIAKERKNDKIQTKVVEVVQHLENIPKPISRKKKRAPAVPHQVTNKNRVLSSENSTTSSTATSTSTSAKHSEAEESESGLCSLIKTTTDESYTEIQPERENKNDQTTPFEFAQPLKPLRKKKMRRSLTWKKDSSLVEAKTLPTTDSETDNKVSKSTSKKVITKPPPLDLKPQLDETVVEPSFVELDKTLMRDVNSPSKVKSAYTLTVFSPPPYSEEELHENAGRKHQHLETSNSWPSLVEENQKDLSYIGKSSSSTEMQKSQKNTEDMRSLADSFDQGFETGSNEIESPVRPVRKASSLKRQNKSYSPLFIKLSNDSRRNSLEPGTKLENPSCFSTPIKEHAQQNFNETNNHSGGAQQQLFSPISQPYKNRRRSLYDSESRRTSLAMQVIREDQPLENHEIQSPRSFTNTGIFFANGPTLDMTDLTGLNEEKTSAFWIKSGEFKVSIDVAYNDSERLKVLYEIFSQKSCDHQDLHFGIDNQKFSVHNERELVNVSRRFPESNDKSHFWFSTGDLAIPFSGKQMSPEKIERLFQFIKTAVEECGILGFGVDDVEFSNVSEFWAQSPKFSMDSNYSMLVGLQSGNSNGLEGRSKYAWPHTKPVPVSDLDQSDYECEDFEETESGRLSYSPYGSNHFDLSTLGSEDLMMPRCGGQAMKSPESFYMEFENEPLDRLFEEKQHSQRSTIEAPTVPQMLNSFQQQQERLSLMQQRLTNYGQPDNLACDALDALKGTPEYVCQLKSIVADISKIGSSSGGFNQCDLDQLERYMFFLSRYADICLNSCSDHMDKILDAMMDRKSTMV